MLKYREILRKAFKSAGILAVCACLVVAAGCDKSSTPEKVEATPASAKPDAPASPIVDLPVGNPTDVVARVYEQKLLRKDLDAQMDRAMASPKMRAIPSDMAPKIRSQIRDDLVDRFVSQAVLLRAADDQKISASDEDRTALAKDIESRLPPGTTLEKLLEKSGVTAEEYKKQLAEEIKIRKVIEKQTASLVPPTADEIKAFYTNSVSQFEMPERVRVRHILVKCEPEAKDAEKTSAKRKAEELRERVAKGEDFAEVAKANSDCPSKAAGGDLGVITRGRTVKPFEDAAFSQQTNAIGPIVETQFGYHIIQVMDRQASGVAPLSEVEKEISERIFGEKRQQAVAEYVAKLKSEADVQRMK